MPRSNKVWICGRKRERERDRGAGLGKAVTMTTTANIFTTNPRGVAAEGGERQQSKMNYVTRRIRQIFLKIIYKQFVVRYESSARLKGKQTNKQTLLYTRPTLLFHSPFCYVNTQHFFFFTISWNSHSSSTLNNFVLLRFLLIHFDIPTTTTTNLNLREFGKVFFFSFFFGLRNG